jgi:putative ABC transport system permease protein
MEIKELFKLSITAIAANKLRSFLTTLGIIIGVFSIIVLVSIGSGIQSYVTSQISSLGSNIIDVLPGSQGDLFGGFLSNNLKLQDSKNIQRAIAGVGKATPILQQTAILKYKNVKNKNAFVGGVSYEYPEVISSLKMYQGRFFTKGQQVSGSAVTVLGYKAYELFFNNQNAIGKRIYVGDKQYTVVGVAEKTGTAFGGFDRDNIVYIPVELAQSQFGTTIVREIVVSANSKELIPIVIKRIEDTLLKKLSKDDFSIETADSISQTISNITNVLSVALGGIAAISLLVGGIGVANIMLVSVTERTREIGLRKALGAKRSDILKQFLLESVMISVTGGLVGIILGMGASVVIAKLLVSTVTPWSVIIAFGFSVLIGIIFGMAPAIRASKLNPIDALRYE